MRTRTFSIAARAVAVFARTRAAQRSPRLHRRGHARDSDVRRRPAGGRLVDRTLDRVRPHRSGRRVERAGGAADRIRLTCRRSAAARPGAPRALTSGARAQRVSRLVA